MIDKTTIKFNYSRRGISLNMDMDGDLCLDELLQEFKHFLLAVSYSPALVERIQLLTEDELADLMLKE